MVGAMRETGQGSSKKGDEDILGSGARKSSKNRPALQATLRVFLHSASPRAKNANGHDGALCLGTAALLEGIRKYGSVAGAAGAMGMSSRVASERLRKLEEELDSRLYYRLPSNKGSRLTRDGVELLDYYQGICRECEAFVNERMSKMQDWRQKMRKDAHKDADAKSAVATAKTTARSRHKGNADFDITDTTCPPESFAP